MPIRHSDVAGEYLRVPQLQFASEVAGSAVTIKEGSIVKYRQI